MTTQATKSTKKQINKWHLVSTNDTGTVRYLFCNGKVVNSSHFTFNNRPDFERSAKRFRCEGCEVALAAYKARLLAEVAKIERRDSDPYGN